MKTRCRKVHTCFRFVQYMASVSKVHTSFLFVQYMASLSNASTAMKTRCHNVHTSFLSVQYNTASVLMPMLRRRLVVAKLTLVSFLSNTWRQYQCQCCYEDLLSQSSHFFSFVQYVYSIRINPSPAIKPITTTTAIRLSMHVVDVRRLTFQSVYFWPLSKVPPQRNSFSSSVINIIAT